MLASEPASAPEESALSERRCGAASRRVSAPTSDHRPRKTPAPARLETEIVRLRLRHTWTTTMSSCEHRDTLQVRLVRDGVTGIGEGAPIVRSHESAQSAREAVESARDAVLAADPWRIEAARAAEAAEAAAAAAAAAAGAERKAQYDDLLVLINEL